MRKVYLAGAILCLLISAFCVWKSLPARPTPMTQPVKDAAQAVTEKTVPVLAPREEPEAPAETPEPYVCPIDFDELKEVNPDIYAWLYIPDTEINYPLLQCSDKGDDYYLTHNLYLEEDANGCLFTEYHYNSADFSDRLTVIYGHRMLSGHVFGSLQDYYSDPEKRDSFQEIIVYTPEKELHYRVFGATPFSAVHIPYQYHGLNNPDSYSEFMNDLKRYRALSAYLDPDVKISEGDQILILSTCLAQDQAQRFLVLAKMVYSTV